MVSQRLQAMLIEVAEGVALQIQVNVELETFVPWTDHLLSLLREQLPISHHFLMDRLRVLKCKK